MRVYRGRLSCLDQTRLVSISRQLQNGLAIVTCSLVAFHADVRRALSPESLPTNVCRRARHEALRTSAWEASSLAIV